MSQFDALELPREHSGFTPTTASRLPVYVEPAPEEALLSWLLRLATRLGISMHALASQSFGVDDRFGHTRWWCRPHPWVLARIAERSDIHVARLRQMTFDGFEPAYRDDEASLRFAGRRYETAMSESPAYRFAVCGPCLENDAKPYLRRQWLLGWMAVCPDHRTILIDRSHACGARFRFGRFTSPASFSPAICRRCGTSVLSGGHIPVHASVIRIQAALLQAKRAGVTEIDGLGRLTWKELVALIDILIGMVYTDLTLAERSRVLRLYLAETYLVPQDDNSIVDSRHGSLRFLAWLIEGWPVSPGAVVGRSLLMRWLTAPRNRLCRHLRPPSADPWTAGPENFEPQIFERLRNLAGVG